MHRRAEIKTFETWRAHNGPAVHYERHRPEQSTLYLLVLLATQPELGTALSKLVQRVVTR
jgi:hypothetical protein